MKKLLITLTSAIALLLITVNGQSEELPTMKVYKSPTCGCCKSWVEYMRDNDFVVEIVDLANLNEIKEKHNIAPELQSCHTAVIDGYVFEGHVPADDVRRLLKEKPDVIGLSAPGMPAKSPGMGSLKPENYSVVSFDKDGKVEVFSEY